MKLILTWDIKPGHEQDYFAYVLQEYLPQLNKFGFEVTDAWVTAFGERPQVLLGAVMESRFKARKVLGSDEWAQVNEQLMAYVDNMEVKLAPHKGNFQF
ncbi:MAG: hypothetical protein PHW11_04055 [Anaerolineaceae bacterium]|nr:hypothetical protein [Anaerolineaceae bacterium]MDD4577887.1 hypothetical protein [Anaerolineaceae bacterium]